MPRNFQHLLLPAIVLLAAGCTSVPGLEAGGYDATLTGLQETPSAGDPDGTGTARIRFTGEPSQLCWEVNVRAIELATAAHIHRGVSGMAGPPVVPITAPGANGRSQGCAAITPELLREMVAEPWGFYVNVHNAAYPGGAVRGQLRGRLAIPRDRPQPRQP